jgi:hypothetical protein
MNNLKKANNFKKQISIFAGSAKNKLQIIVLYYDA